jgi:hypothetical protein
MLTGPGRTARPCILSRRRGHAQLCPAARAGRCLILVQKCVARQRRTLHLPSGGPTSLRSHHGGRRAQTRPGSSTDATKTHEPSRSWRRTRNSPRHPPDRGARSDDSILDLTVAATRIPHGIVSHRAGSQHRQDPLIMPDPRASRRGGFAFLPSRQIDGSGSPRLLRSLIPGTSIRFVRVRSYDRPGRSIVTVLLETSM